MSCFAPLFGWMSRAKTDKGKRTVVFDRSLGYTDRPVTVSCGKCVGCRLEFSRKWAMRCEHEASLHDENCFVTLTYEKMPEGGSLQPNDFTKFMKKLRRRRSGRIRYLQTGEYGALGRPHHHLLLFGCDFADCKRVKKSSTGQWLYRSEELEGLWEHGFSTIGSMTFESAGYVARYSLKKMFAPQVPGRVPEYMTMSRNPGIGAGWIDKYKSDVFPDDEVIIRGGIRCKPPRYYLERHSDVMEQVIADRKRYFKDLPHEDWLKSGYRSRAREKMALQRLGEAESRKEV